MTGYELGCFPGHAPCPSCAIRVGDWHTHGNGEFGELPSPEDRVNCPRGQNCYLGTPSGSFLLYDKGTTIYLRKGKR